MRDIMVEHTMRAFDVDLQELAGEIDAMGRLAEMQIANAIEALSKRDVALAKRVIAGDDEVDALHRKIENKVLVTIARRQPMAIDLRELLGALHISNDVERIGDLAENIARRVLILTSETPTNEAIRQIERMMKFVLVQMRRVIHSYAKRDVAEAIEIWGQDAEIDAMNSSLFRELLTYMMEDPRHITFCTHLLLCAKDIERMGDHITNIAEYIHDIVEGRPFPDQRLQADVASKASIPLPA
jgi:phosphate transport system protein